MDQTEHGVQTVSSVRFNQTNSCVAVATCTGLQIYYCDPFQLSYQTDEGGLKIAQMLFNSSLLCLVGAGQDADKSPRTLRLFNTKTEKSICELNFLSTVLDVQINQERLVVVLEHKLHVFCLKSMKILHTLDTPANPTGVCALSTSMEKCYLALPCRADRGEALIYDALNLQVLTVIRAHNNPLRLMAMDPTGTLLATVSEKGTVIRVFSIPGGERLHIFRRGTQSAQVNSISFNSTSTLLCSTSVGSSTIHIFSLETKTSNEPTTSEAVASTAVSFLPSVLHDLVEPVRGFARINLRGAEEGVAARVCGFSGERCVFIVTTGGHFYRYRISEDGGPCKLEAEHTLLQTPSEEMGVIVNMGEEEEEKGGFHAKRD